MRQNYKDATSIHAQSPKQYCLKSPDNMAIQDMWTLPELVQATLEVLNQNYGIRDIQPCEGLRLRLHIERAAEAWERGIREGISEGSLGGPAEEAARLFMYEAYGVTTEMASKTPGAMLFAWIEGLRDRSLSNGLDSRPHYNRLMRSQLDKPEAWESYLDYFRRMP